MDKEETKSVVTLFDWHTEGHHPTYLCTYAQAFLESGRKVNIGSLENDWLDAKLRSLGYRNGINYLITTITPYPRLRRKPNIRARFRDWKGSSEFICSLKRSIRNAEKRLNTTCQHIHFACIYEEESALIGLALDRLRTPASGLYLQANSFHEEHNSDSESMLALLRNQYLGAVLLLDELVQEKVKDATSAKVITAPDFTNTETSERSWIAQQVCEKLGHCPKIAMVGYLKKSKGLLELCRLAASGKLDNVGIIIVGEVKWKDFNPDETSFITDTCSTKSNIWSMLSKVDDERDYNALINCSDVLLAPYHNFPHSSNTLAKAAHFEKPIIVNDCGVLAKRVASFKIGEVINNGSPDGLEESINRVCINIEKWKEENSPRWNDYIKDHSVSRLSTTIQAVVEQIEKLNP